MKPKPGIPASTAPKRLPETPGVYVCDKCGLIYLTATRHSGFISCARCRFTTGHVVEMRFKPVTMPAKRLCFFDKPEEPKCQPK